MMDRAMVAREYADFERDGAVCLRGVIGMGWIELLRRGVERNLAEPGPFAKHYTPAGASGRFMGDYCNWRRIPEYREFLEGSPVARIAGLFMEASKVNLFHEHVLVKEPSTPEPTPWHHDLPYWAVSGNQVVSLWIPLDEVARETSVEYVAGSHKWGRWFAPKSFSTRQNHVAVDETLDQVPDIDGARDKYELLGWEMAPGDLILFHGLTLHGAPGNRSNRRRRAFAARFTGDDVRYAPKPGFLSPPPEAFPGAPEPGQPMDGEAFPVLWRKPVETGS